MKRRDFIKAGLMTAGGLLIPGKASGLLIPGKASGLEVLANGKIINTLSEAPVENAKLKFYSYPGNELISEHMTNSNGEYNTVPIAVGYDKWMDVKKLYNNNPEFDNLRKIALEKRVAKRANNGILKLEIKHDNYFDAVRYADLSQGEFNTDIIPKTFDMELFDMWCRDPALGGGTQRWEEQPKWYIITNVLDKTIEVEQNKINMAKNIIQNDLVQFTNGFINNPYIEEGKQDDILSKASYGSIIVYWRNYGGPGEHGEDLENNKIVAGTVSFNTIEPVKGTYLEELTQVLGPRTGTETRYFFDDKGYLESGPQIGKVLYSRPIGSKTQDEDPEP